MNARIFLYKISLIVAGLVSVALPAVAATHRPSLDFRYGAMYESNVFHSYSDIDRTGAMLNELSLEAEWRLGRRTLYHRVTPYLEMDLYPSYNGRNKGSFGVEYEPTFRYNRHGRLRLTADISRRNKDLVDDAGNVLNRTLRKWEYDIEVQHRYDWSRLRLEQVLGYSIDNYDERTDSATALPLQSYDYQGWFAEAVARLDIRSRLEAAVEYRFEAREYDERRTYTVQYGAFVGRPYEIRHFTEHTIGAGIDYELIPDVTIGMDFEYAFRKDNFENFYGFYHRQYRAVIVLEPIKHHKTRISFRFKNKDYPNYWNSRIGLLDRVSVDYADFQIEHEYEISHVVELLVSLRNYNKVSNDPTYNYRDLTAGTGIRLRY